MQEARVQLACYVRTEEAAEIQSLQQRLSKHYKTRVSMQSLMTMLVVTGLQRAENCDFIRIMLDTEKQNEERSSKPAAKVKPFKLPKNPTVWDLKMAAQSAAAQAAEVKDTPRSAKTHRTAPRPKPDSRRKTPATTIASSEPGEKTE